MEQRVEPDKIRELSGGMERLNRIVNDTSQMYAEMDKLTRDIPAQYPESGYVQSATREVDDLLREIRDLAMSLHERLDGKASTLKKTAGQYEENEEKLKLILSKSPTFSWVNMGTKWDGKVAVKPPFMDKWKLPLLQARKSTPTESADKIEVETPEEIPVNRANLDRLLQQYSDEEGYTLFAGEVLYQAVLFDEVPKFIAFALDKGYDPDTFEYLEYWERSEAYQRLEGKTKQLEQEIVDYREHYLDGYEEIAFGRGFINGMDRNVDDIFNTTVEIVKHPIDSGKAAIEGIKQIYVDINEEIEKYQKDPMGYIEKTVKDTWGSMEKFYKEFKELTPSQRSERIGEIVGENAISAAVSAVGGGMVGQSIKKVVLVINSKVDIKIPEMKLLDDLDKSDVGEGNKSGIGETGKPKPLDMPSTVDPLKRTGENRLPSRTIDSLYERTQNIRGDINSEIEKLRNSEEYKSLSKTQRDKLDRKLRKLNSGNVAVADVSIPGIKKEFQAHSQIHSSDSVGSNVGDFSNSKADKSLETYVDDDFPRFNDTEAKILEDIASQIKDPNVKGQIDLFTELDACQSCTNLIMEFRSKFPNIQLNVYSENMK
ncbi:hypothetical protein J2T13_001435 [Paenibacillus sp. DS2015]|uniref:deaminase domain-containing protein n=1 Tax=Paenibacillus sp. DS2015 TaxID=3373917 RepID=UPI003D23CD44